MPQDLVPRRYSPEEVRAILGRALKKDNAGGLVSQDELRETAAELGVSQEALQAAMDEHDVQTAMETAREEYRGLRRQKLVRQFATWAGVNGVLTVLDLAQNGLVEWSVYPAAIWGVMVLWSTARTLFITSEDVDKGAHKLVEQKDRRTKQLMRARR